MNEEQIKKLSMKLSWLLRHGANETGLQMDNAGWAEVASVRRELRIDEEQLQQVVRENNKSRLQLENGRIRACQGHSPSGTPVTLEALEASWKPFEGAGVIWHGTNIDALVAIARDGLLPMGRTHVHLAETEESKVGKRANTPVLLAVSVEKLVTAGLSVFVSQNGVLLVRRVPVTAIVDLDTRSRAATARASELRALFC